MALVDDIALCRKRCATARLVLSELQQEYPKKIIAMEARHRDEKQALADEIAAANSEVARLRDQYTALVEEAAIAARV